MPKDVSGKIELRECDLRGKLYLPHTIYQAILTDTPLKHWFCKETIDAEEAEFEVLAQEFFRLIIPHQPVYRYVTANSKHFVLSEEVTNFRYLKKDISPQGVGAVLVCAMFLEEIDMKTPNIGFNSKGQVVKIDGDWCFASLSFAERQGKTLGQGYYYELSPRAIENLPIPSGFYAYNWVNFISEGRKTPNDACLDIDKCKASERFCLEVNQALLSIMLLPDSFIKCFIEAYVSFPPAVNDEDVTFEDVFAFFISRRELLKHAALEIPSFRDYVLSLQASVQCQQILSRMQTHTQEGERIVSDEVFLELRQSANEALFNIQKRAEVLSALTDGLKKSRRSLLDQIGLVWDKRCYVNDKELRGELDQMVDQIYAGDASDINLLIELRCQLDSISEEQENLLIEKWQRRLSSWSERVVELDPSKQEAMQNLRKETPQDVTTLKARLNSLNQTLIPLYRMKCDAAIASLTSDPLLRTYVEFEQQVGKLEGAIQEPYYHWMQLEHLEKEIQAAHEQLQCKARTDSLLLKVRNLEQYSIGTTDETMQTYITSMITKIRAKNTLNELEQLDHELDQAIESASSHEVTVVQEAIETLNASWVPNFFSGATDKAGNIKTKLLAMPILERGTLLSRDDVNAVKLALAEKRSDPLCDIFDIRGHICESRAARSFRCAMERVRFWEQSHSNASSSGANPGSSNCEGRF